jgi:mitogen-activated protein kinase 15
MAHREIMFLQELNNHENIIKLWNVLKADNDRDIYREFAPELHPVQMERSKQTHTYLPRPLSAHAVVFEFMDTDLHAVIRANILEEVTFPKSSKGRFDLLRICILFFDSGHARCKCIRSWFRKMRTFDCVTALSQVHKQYIMYQLLKALKYMHSAGMLHRDMKVMIKNNLRTIALNIALPNVTSS